MTFDWSFVQRYAPFFVNGTLMTLFISVFGILLAIAVGSGLRWRGNRAYPGRPANRENLSNSAAIRHCWYSCTFCTSACPNSA